MDVESNGENVGENLNHSSASQLNLSPMTNLTYVRAYVPVSAPAHYANARVYARARNNGVIPLQALQSQKNEPLPHTQELLCIQRLSVPMALRHSRSRLCH
jgi:hypothetical protein